MPAASGGYTMCDAERWHARVGGLETTPQGFTSAGTLHAGACSTAPQRPPVDAHCHALMTDGNRSWNCRDTSRLLGLKTDLPWLFPHIEGLTLKRDIHTEANLKRENIHTKRNLLGLSFPTFLLVLLNDTAWYRAPSPQRTGKVRMLHV